MSSRAMPETTTTGTEISAGGASALWDLVARWQAEADADRGAPGMLPAVRRRTLSRCARDLSDAIGGRDPGHGD